MNAARNLSVLILTALPFGCAKMPDPGTLVSAAGATGPAVKFAAQKTVDEGKFLRDFEHATALLQQQTINGGFEMLCTATVFEKDDKALRFVTAAHCVSEDDEIKERAKLTSTKFYISFDDSENKNFYLVKVAAVGYQHRGDDFAVLEIPLKDLHDQNVPVMPLATEPLVMGELMANMASPNGLGKQLFKGHVSRPQLQRPVKERDINWENAVLLQMIVDGGSSGSAVVSLRQYGIAAILVGHVYRINTIALPVERFVKFWEMSKAGKYKWYKPDTTASSDQARKNHDKKAKELQEPDETASPAPEDK